jgi:glucose/arabinose dehydrogenase
MSTAGQDARGNGMEGRAPHCTALPGTRFECNRAVTFFFCVSNRAARNMRGKVLWRTPRFHDISVPGRIDQRGSEPNFMKRLLSTVSGTIIGATLVFAAVAHAQQDVLPPVPLGNISITLEAVATGLGAPLYGISAPGDTNRFFVLEQKGQVLVMENGALLPTPALDISSLVSPPFVPTSPNDERGLLGIAFHPGFNDVTSPGFRTLYTYNSEPIPTGTNPTFIAPNNATQNYKNVINEFKMSLANPNVIDPATRREVVSFGKNAGNHNGGTITFGPDGYMYLGTGDGGNANDSGASHIEPGGNAQNLTTPLGKMLRINPLNPSLNPTSTDPVSGNGQYRIPADNPFQGAGEVREIYAYGFRNPYRFSFDKLNGQLIVADVGQNTVEEIDRVTRGGNYGWAVKEGDFLFNRTTGPGGNAGTVGPRSPGVPAGLIDPIVGTLGTLEYDHGDGISITGGFVYRGTEIPELYGKYVFGDLAISTTPVRIDGRLFYADLETGQIFEFIMPQFGGKGILPDNQTVHGFGEDAQGELFAFATNTASSGTGGVIYRIHGIPEPTTAALLAISAIGLALGGRRRADAATHER